LLTGIPHRRLAAKLDDAVGHNRRAEVVDETVFIAKQFGISALARLQITP